MRRRLWVSEFYAITYRMSQRADNPYPIYSISLAQFESQRDLAQELQHSQSLMYQYPRIEQIDDPSIDGADGAAAFTYSVNDGVDSVRVFAQAEAFLIIVDIEGSPALDDAISIATAYAQANVACVADGECAAPTGLPGQDESTPTPTDFFGALGQSGGERSDPEITRKRPGKRRWVTTEAYGKGTPNAPRALSWRSSLFCWGSTPFSLLPNWPSFSARKTRLRPLAENGNRAARRVWPPRISLPASSPPFRSALPWPAFLPQQ